MTHRKSAPTRQQFDHSLAIMGGVVKYLDENKLIREPARGQFDQALETMREAGDFLDELTGMLLIAHNLLQVAHDELQCTKNDLCVRCTIAAFLGKAAT